ncbi:MAG: alpha,alpha-trehalase TreA [Filimonas sp.]|nr:alpha,alpha-trehalase TreA [Filimonas sp.]
MRKLSFLCLLFISSIVHAQYGNVEPPDKIYGVLFRDVQMNRIFRDGKTFVDCVPKSDPKEIVQSYKDIKSNRAIRFSLKEFVAGNFTEPPASADNYTSDKAQPVTTHITQLWEKLKRSPDKPAKGSSLLPLPYPYIVPGGRFREVYYWDSYFTMLGLQESGEDALLENIVNNFTYMIQQYGHIPNGNRSYYLSRSQPPYFALMVDLLAEKKGQQVYAQYQMALQREYNYWMDKRGGAKHVVRMPDGSVLNRYYDLDDVPRQESYYEDSMLTIGYSGSAKTLYRNLRSGAESGWDFSTRWFADGSHLNTIQTTNLVPVDLNALLYHLEMTLSKAYKSSGNLLQSNLYAQIANKRKNAINKYLYNPADGWYYDYVTSTKQLSNEMTIAGITPYFFMIPPKATSARAIKVVEDKFLKAGGVVTTLKNSGQQWDAPNGWAPLQWITIIGLENYGANDLAKKIADRWIQLNIKVYKATGKLVEKYNVEDVNVEAGGGEYPAQDGFGWTNGVLLKLMNKYGVKE